MDCVLTRLVLLSDTEEFLTSSIASEMFSVLSQLSLEATYRTTHASINAINAIEHHSLLLLWNANFASACQLTFLMHQCFSRLHFQPSAQWGARAPVSNSDWWAYCCKLRVGLPSGKVHESRSCFQETMVYVVHELGLNSMLADQLFIVHNAHERFSSCDNGSIKTWSLTLGTSFVTLNA